MNNTFGGRGGAEQGFGERGTGSDEYSRAASGDWKMYLLPPPPSRVARELCLLSHWPRRPNCAAHALGSRWHSQCPVPNHYIISRGEVDRSPLMHYPSAPWCRPGQRGDAELSIKRTDDLWKVEVRCATTRWDDSVRGGMSKR